MISWLKFLNKERWALVKTIDTEVSRTRDITQTGKVYFQLYESDKGRRKVDIHCTLSNVDLKAARRLEIYQEQIYRWEMGRFDPNIPRYADIPAEDIMAALKGKI